MGIISFFKKLFSKNISVSGDLSTHLVYVYKLKKGKVWLDSKLTVPENFNFAICKNGKVLDVFPSGEQELKAIFLPKSVKRFGLAKIQKNGKFPNSFAADAYFVNLNSFEYEKWEAYRKIEMFDSFYGYYRFKLSGAFAFKIIDTKKFLKAMLKCYAYLRQNEAREILSGFVSEFVIGEIEKQKVEFKIINNKEALTEKLFEVMQGKFEWLGIEVLGLAVTKTDLPKKLRKRLEREIEI